AACARCHGPNGSFYGPDLGKGKTDAQLQKVIREMAEGPSQLPGLPPVELEAQTAYHRALIQSEPFLAVTRRTPTRIEGEVTSGAAVGVSVGGKTTSAKVDGSQWSAPLEANGAAPLVTATLGKATTTLNTARAAFSHAVPLAGRPKTDPPPDRSPPQAQRQ
ncbi:MAG: cytochrome c, partial [Cytophagales bacterium]|nr:cytochrome c [Armatimonadota bacterium]